LAAFGVSAIPSARDKRVLLRVRDVLDTASFQVIPTKIKAIEECLLCRRVRSAN